MDFGNVNWLLMATVLERPSSQMSYLDHFLKESGGTTTNTMHTTSSSTIAVNMVSLELILVFIWEIAVLQAPNDLMMIPFPNSRPKETCKINPQRVRLPITFRINSHRSRSILSSSSNSSSNSRKTQTHSPSRTWCCTIRAIQLKVRATSRIIQLTVCPVRKAILARIQW